MMLETQQLHAMTLLELCDGIIPCPFKAIVSFGKRKSFCFWPYIYTQTKQSNQVFCHYGETILLSFTFWVNLLHILFRCYNLLV